MSHCARCGGALYADYDGDRTCWRCGWVRPPERSAEELALFARETTPHGDGRMRMRKPLTGVLYRIPEKQRWWDRGEG